MNLTEVLIVLYRSLPQIMSIAMAEISLLISPMTYKECH